jgi:RND superfamily putative drug exporter
MSTSSAWGATTSSPQAVKWGTSHDPTKPWPPVTNARTRRTVAGHTVDAMLQRLADWCYTRRRIVLALWVVGLVVIGGVSAAVGTNYTNNFKNPGTESQEAFDLLQSRFPARSGDTGAIVFRAPQGIDQPAMRSRLEDLFRQVQQSPHVLGVVTPYSTEGARQVSQNHQIAFAEVQFDQRAYDVTGATVSHIQGLVDRANGNGLQIETGGTVFSSRVTPHGQEAVGLLAAMVILLITFGSLLAMGLPLMTALFGIGIGSALLGLITHLLPTPVFAPQVASMISIGVGVDYALFIVTRYRSALDTTGDPHASVIEAITTAGRAVLFAGTTVVISLMGMLLMGFAFVRGLAVGASVAVLITMLAAITLLPAVLGFVGKNINKLKLPGVHTNTAGHRDTLAWRYSRSIQRRPWPMAIGALVVLLALAAPVLSLRLGVSDDGNLPKNTSARKGYDLLSAGFGPGFNGPFLVAADLRGADNGQAALGRLVGDLRHTKGVAFASPPVANPSGDAAILTVYPTTAPQDAATTRLLHHLRSDVVPAALQGSGVKAYTGGLVAAFDDQTTKMSSRLPWFFGVVIILSFLLLMAVFRSLLVPLKAAIMNLLSIGAAYGILVAVFQWGWLSKLTGVTKGPIESWLPMMLFAILFGLSMDYEVFLLSRIREEWLRSGDNGLAVADGLAHTARVITAAAAIMVAVFMAFALADLRVLKEAGVGLASAVFIDATVVRMVLVPATMELLGERNWWLPRWLDRVVPTVSVEDVEPDEDKELEPVGA